jgi:hypothetical protein
LAKLQPTAVVLAQIRQLRQTCQTSAGAIAMPSFLSRLFGSPAPVVVEPVLHKDCRIYAQPIKDGAVYRIAGRIEKDVGGATKTHSLMRADTFTSLDEATEATLGKAKQAIDQLGDSLFT